MGSAQGGRQSQETPGLLRRGEVGFLRMKTEYALSRLKAGKNPYASKLKKPVTLRLSEDVVAYFKGMAEEAGVPYQGLFNLYLRDCIANHRKIQINWPHAA